MNTIAAHEPFTACLYDRQQNSWLQFLEPDEIICVYDYEKVIPALQHLDAVTKNRQMYAVGFVSYDAAPAFDQALQTHRDPSFPLLWFALFPASEVTTKIAAPSESCDGAIEHTWEPNISRAQYDDAIQTIKQHIEYGNTYQVNYSFRLKSILREKPWKFFGHMITSQGSGYGAYVETKDWIICSASPELFFEKNGAQLLSRPMKGTTRRGLQRHDDLAQAEWLRQSAKNRAENLMIVDMVRHDLGRIAHTGSIQASPLFEIEQYNTVWQMASTITARTDANLTGVFQALFPAASITGAPKVRTMQIIRDLETEPRRIYTGTVGFITPTGRCQFNVAIRTVLVNKKNHAAEYGVGGGIVWDSTDTGEYDECRTKSKVLTESRPRFQLLETLLWHPSEGFFLLERHLDRLEESAAYFGFPFDRDRVRQRLLAAAPDQQSNPCKTRLLYSPNGSVAIEHEALPEPSRKRPVRLRLAANPIDPQNIFLYHKTTNRQIYEQAMKATEDCDDVLLWNTSGEITETCIANIVVELNGKLVTPPVNSGLLPGTFRADLLNRGVITEQVISLDKLREATKIYLINSVRKWRIAKFSSESLPAISL